MIIYRVVLVLCRAFPVPAYGCSVCEDASNMNVGIIYIIQ